MQSFRVPGLSFEVAPAAQAHPNRTDIALIVGTVARRARRPDSDAAAAASRRALPALLRPFVREWARLPEGDPALAALQIDLRSVDACMAALIDSLLAAGWTGFADFATFRTAFAARRADSSRVALSDEDLAWWRGWRIEADMLARVLDALARLSDTPAETARWLDQQGWRHGQLLRGSALASAERLLRLQQLPVPVDSFATFDALFDWDGLALGAAAPGTRIVAPLGAAVRAFFAEGGRRCYVVRTGDPVPPTATAEARVRVLGGRGAASPQLPGIERFELRGDLLAGVLTLSDPVPASSADYAGLDHVFALPDVALACLPDLAQACAQPLPALAQPAFVTARRASFEDCVADTPMPRGADGSLLAPPRVHGPGLDVWRNLVQHAVDRLANGGRALHRRDVQLVASLPLLGEGRDLPAEDDWVAWMAERDRAERDRTVSSSPSASTASAPRTRAPVAASTNSSAPSARRSSSSAVTDAPRRRWLAEARVQLAYPWLVTPDSAQCQGGIEAPEGTLLGVLARNAITRGTYRSAAFQPVQRLLRTEPVLDQTRALTQPVQTPDGPLALADRVCLLLPGPRGPQLWSDVTLCGTRDERPGAVRRLVNVILQRARSLGETSVFDANGEALWQRVRDALEDLGAALARAGALRNDPGIRAWEVRCGWQTMTQNDVDAGRVLAEVAFVPAQPVQRIVVVLALRATNGQLLAAA